MEQRDGELAELFVGGEDHQGFHAALLRVNKAGDYKWTRLPELGMRSFKLFLVIVDATAGLFGCGGSLVGDFGCDGRG
jgi:hypothetical protein